MTDTLSSERPRDRFPPAIDGLHGSVRPANIRKDDRILAKLKFESRLANCQVYRLSPFGIELVVSTDDAPTKGAIVEIELTVEGKTNLHPGTVVESCDPFVKSGDKLVGVRFTADNESLQDNSGSERRTAERWICSEDFFPTAVTPTPGRLNDYIYFRIYDISSSGMRMKCSLRNKHLLPEMKLELLAQFPGSESAQLDIVIKRIRIEEEAGKDILALGVEFDNLSERARQSIGQYLVQFSAVATPAEIRSAGFRIESVALGAEFYFLKTHDDYVKVLELRKLAHAKDGNVDPSISIEELGDINDTRARIIVGKMKGVVVATARLRYNESDTPLEHEDFLEWPSDFPRRDQIVEISRAATHPDYRRGELFAALWKYMATYALQKQRPYVLIGSAGRLVDFYKKCGFKETGHAHNEEMWTIPQVIMLCNLHEAAMGKDTHPLYWNQFYAPIVDGAIDAGILNPGELDRIRMNTFRKLGWLTKLRFRKPRKK